MKSDLYLQARWPRTRRRLLSLIKAAVPVLEFETKEAITDAQWDAFVGDVLSSLRDGQIANEPGSHTYALLDASQDVFQNVHIMRALFDKNTEALSTGNMGVVHTICSRALSQMRDSALPGSLHHRRVWSSYDRISRDIVADKPGYNRCQAEHFEVVATRVAERHASDHNLSSNVDYVASIFHEFCEDCLESLDQPDATGQTMGENLADEGAGDYAAIIDKQALIGVLMTCITKLEDRFASIIRHNYGFEGAHDALSVSAFCKEINIGRTTYHERKAKAEKLLTACIETHGTSADNVVGLFE